MKLLNLIMWLGIIFAIVVILMGFIDFLGGGGVFGLKHSSTFFTIANTGLLFAVVAKVIGFNSDKN